MAFLTVNEVDYIGGFAGEVMSDGVCLLGPDASECGSVE